MHEYYSEIHELNPAKKNMEYAQRIIRSIRDNWVSYVNKKQVSTNREFLYGTNSIQDIKDQFKDSGFKNSHEFLNLGLLDSTRNVLIEENRKNPPMVDIKAVDPAAMAERQKDIDLLRNRGIIERDMSAILNQIGFSAGYKFKNKEAKSNIDEFDELGFDERDPDDINFFKNRHKLFHEIAGQSLVNSIMMTNRFDEEIVNKITEDVLVGRCYSLQAYVDKTNGQIRYKHIYPEIAKGIFGEAYDGSQDTVRGWEDAITISEFLQLVGNEFNYEKDVKHLLAAINTGGSQNKYTGFDYSPGRFYECLGTNDAEYCNIKDVPTSNRITWGSALRHKITVSYIQWRTWEATSTVLRDLSTEKILDIVDYGYEDEKTEVKSYFKDSRYQQQWYNAYCIVTGTTSEKIYGFSKVYYQQFQGANDEYANGTLVYMREPGLPAVETVKTEIKLIHSAYYKMLFLIYKAQPEAKQYVWEELVELNKLIASEKSKDSGVEVSPTVDNMIGELIQYMDENTIMIRTFPSVDGRRVQQIPSLENKRNGADPLTQFMMSVVEWGQKRIESRILGNGMRLGGNPQSRESTESEQNSVDASKNTTGYISRMCQKAKERLATMTLNYAQDIIRFKESVPYKYIKTLLGEQAFLGLDMGESVADHRYGIFIRDYNNDVDRAQLKQAAYMAVTQEKLISWDEFYEIMQTQDLKAASQRYALYRYKAEKKLRKQAMQDFEMQRSAAEQADGRKMQMLMFERETKLLDTKESNKAIIEGHRIDYQKAVDTKQMVIQAEPEKQAAKARGNESTQILKNNLEESNPYQG